MTDRHIREIVIKYSDYSEVVIFKEDFDKAEALDEASEYLDNMRDLKKRLDNIFTP